MKQHWINNFALRKRAFAGVVLPVVLAACGGASETAQSPATVMAPVMASSVVDTLKAGGGAKGARIYSVINLGPDGADVLLNERGQAAFGSYNSDGVTNGFFDGDRLHDLGSLGGSYTRILSLNNQGMVVGESEDAVRPFSEIHAYAWTVGGGMRALARSAAARAFDVNDQGQIAGQMPADGISARAVRWDPDGSVTDLGPQPLSLSIASAINNDGVATGFTNVAGGATHATAWGLGGNVNDLGTLGGNWANGRFINERGQVAGLSNTLANARETGFFWSAEDGMVAIDVQGGGSRLVAGLNDQGEVVGNTTVSGRSAAYLWSRLRGLTLLPLGTAVRSDGFDVNNHSEMVGSIQRPAAEGGGLRAVHWPGIAKPIDLNTKLDRTPAGLVLHAAAAINDAGVILAHSNAGLVLLRPGKQGTDAPVLGPIIGLPATFAIGQQVDLTVGFIDNARGESHTAAVIWGDNCPSPPPVLRESGGKGEVRLQHRFCATGYFSVKVQVTDSAGNMTQVRREIELYDPALGGPAANMAIADRNSVLRGGVSLRN